jgi:hypothetical protein
MFFNQDCRDTTKRDATALSALERLPIKRLQEGKIGYILLWALGVPIPVLFLIYLLRGCT